jgi:hypothetical protein
MALTSTQLETMKDALQTAMYKGVQRIIFQDRAIHYQSVDEMRKAVADIDSQLAGLSGTPESRRSFAGFSKG